MTDSEVLNNVARLKPSVPKSPPQPHPSMNPGCYMNGRGVYEVEEEMLALFSQLSNRRLRRLFQRQQWRLWFMWHKYYPTNVKSILAERREYLESLN